MPIPKILVTFLDGVPFRKLADIYDKSPATLFLKCFKIAKDLPHCADVTRKYCSRFQGILVVDGKYVKVLGYEKKIPFIYGIDYATHDIPTFKLVPSESYLAWKKYFQSLRLLNYPLKMVIADDNENIRKALYDIYPKAHFQLCLNHFTENIRNTLMVRTDPTYRDFMHELNILFVSKRSEDDFNRMANNILNNYIEKDLCVKIMLDIENKKDILLGYLKTKGTPRTNNIIESYNSHFQARFKSIKGFKSFSSAKIWINALILRRRFKVLTDCKGKFKSLNGKSSISKSKNKNVDLPTFLEFLGAKF